MIPREIALAGDLTDRERVVLQSYGELGSYKAVALRLGISVATVRNHLSNVRAKRGVKRTAQLFVHRSRRVNV